MFGTINIKKAACKSYAYNFYSLQFESKELTNNNRYTVLHYQHSSWSQNLDFSNAMACFITFVQFVVNVTDLNL